MLVLTRKIGERVVIGHDIEVTVLKIQGSRVKLGIRGPADVPIHRKELQARIRHASKDANFGRTFSAELTFDQPEEEEWNSTIPGSRSGQVSGLATRPDCQLAQDRETADRELERRIRNFLEGLSLPELRDLELEVRNGSAVVTGRVRTFYEKQLATSCCQRVARRSERAQRGPGGRLVRDACNASRWALTAPIGLVGTAIVSRVAVCKRPRMCYIRLCEYVVVPGRFHQPRHPQATWNKLCSAHRGFRFAVLGCAAALPCSSGTRCSLICAETGNDHVAPKAAAADGALDEQFDNPESIVKTFASKLKRLFGKAGTVSPALLNKQLETATKHAVATVAEPTERLPSEAIYARVRAGVVIIGAIPGADNPDQSEPVFASGFVVHKDGLIVSNAHVIEAFGHMKAVGAMTSDGQVFLIKAVLAADTLNDVALFKIDATSLTPLPVARSVPVGATIYCLSHPVMNSMGTEFGFFAFTQGIVSGRYRTKLMGETPVNVLTITADYAEGSSGGPILNEHGAVVGIVCQTLAIGDEDGSNQMTWKFARPASSILASLQAPRRP